MPYFIRLQKKDVLVIPPQKGPGVVTLPGHIPREHHSNIPKSAVYYTVFLNPKGVGSFGPDDTVSLTKEEEKELKSQLMSYKDLKRYEVSDLFKSMKRVQHI